ncbi:hypothetical protein [Shouchella hunanensis]|uniref:Uncharacterized protein n=1 Tax=Shouchella hunanensis TaxID=766894 RepID=A0ABY7WB26_9BACI|nr:hypothetical protein [Shouchella hunanensis]WDF04798.1 hypothetical protein PQ477_04880 [Shouchella hunanensis]
MKHEQLVYGYVLFGAGVVLFGLMHLAIALTMPVNINSDWRLSNSLSNISGWIPYSMSIILMVIGLVIILTYAYMNWLYSEEKEEEKNGQSEKRQGP